MQRKDNIGFAAIRSWDCKPKTICVTGVGRSGTTGMIRALHATGLPKTGKRTSSTQDDHLIGHALPNRKDLLAAIEPINKRFDVWGWKYPLAWQQSQNFDLFQNMVIVVMVRDTFAIANRAWTASRKTKTLSYWINQIHTWETELYDWALHISSLPIAFVSYEKFLLRPVSVMRAVTNFCDLKYVPDCVDVINPEDKKYTQSMAFHRYCDDNDN